MNKNFSLLPFFMSSFIFTSEVHKGVELVSQKHHFSKKELLPFVAAADHILVPLFSRLLDKKYQRLDNPDIEKIVAVRGEELEKPKFWSTAAGLIILNYPKGEGTSFSIVSILTPLHKMSFFTSDEHDAELQLHILKQAPHLRTVYEHIRFGKALPNYHEVEGSITVITALEDTESGLQLTLPRHFPNGSHWSELLISFKVQNSSTKKITKEVEKLEHRLKISRRDLLGHKDTLADFFAQKKIVSTDNRDAVFKEFCKIAEVCKEKKSMQSCEKVSDAKVNREKGFVVLPDLEDFEFVTNEEADDTLESFSDEESIS